MCQGEENVDLYKVLSLYLIYMDKTEKYDYWLQHAQYDLDSADAMHSSGRWFYVAFMCQQALEKNCKGLYNYYVGDDVPKVHNIGLIAQKLETALSITFSEEAYKLIDKLSALYLNSRYPDFAVNSNINVKKEQADYYLSKTREVYSWLQTLKK